MCWGGLAGAPGCLTQRGHLAQVDISQSLAVGRTQAGKKPGTSHTHIQTLETHTHTHTHTVVMFMDYVIRINSSLGRTLNSHQAVTAKRPPESLY